MASVTEFTFWWLLAAAAAVIFLLWSVRAIRF